MSEYESLREDIAGLGHAMGLYAGSVNRHTELTNAEIARLWADNGELRDELHAVANRLENLTRAVTTEPAEVAEAMVPVTRIFYPFCGRDGCNVLTQHSHAANGAIHQVTDDLDAS